nr:hypothetical protein [Tanacetum cinerariifolium]
MQVRVSSGSESPSHTESGMRFMLAPRSANAQHSSIPRNSQGIRNFPGSPSFLGNLFSMTAEQCSFIVATPLRVVIPFKSSSGLVMVLLGSVPDPEDVAVLELINLDSILVEITSSILIEIVPPIEIVLIILMGMKTGRSNLIRSHLRSNALTISLSSETSDETAGVEELVLTLATIAMARD